MFGKKKAIGNEAKPNKKSPAASFFKTVFIIVVCFIALSFVAVYAYTKATYTPEKGYEKAPINAYLLFHFSYFAQAIAHISTENSIFASSFQLNKLFYLW